MEIKDTRRKVINAEKGIIGEVNDLRTGYKSSSPLKDTMDFDDGGFYGFCSNFEHINNGYKMIWKLKWSAIREF